MLLWLLSNGYESGGSFLLCQLVASTRLNCWAQNLLRLLLLRLRLLLLLWLLFCVWVELVVARVILIAVRLTVAPWENECSTRKAAQRRQFDFNWLHSLSYLFLKSSILLKRKEKKRKREKPRFILFIYLFIYLLLFFFFYGTQTKRDDVIITFLFFFVFCGVVSVRAHPWSFNRLFMFIGVMKCCLNILDNNWNSAACVNYSSWFDGWYFGNGKGRRLLKLVARCGDTISYFIFHFSYLWGFEATGSSAVVSFRLPKQLIAVCNCRCCCAPNWRLINWRIGSEAH